MQETTAKCRIPRLEKMITIRNIDEIRVIVVSIQSVNDLVIDEKMDKYGQKEHLEAGEHVIEGWKLTSLGF